MVISQPREMFRTSVHLTISTSVLEGQSDPNLTRVDIVFEARSNPHGHGMLGVCGSVPPPLPILRVGCMFLDILLLIRKEPSCIEHLTNFQLDLHNMLITRHMCDFSRYQRKKENIHSYSRQYCTHELRCLRKRRNRWGVSRFSLLFVGWRHTSLLSGCGRSHGRECG